MGVPSEGVLDSSSSGWCPKITPYRLAFILTTGGLGVAKAVSISERRAAASITLEWVAGVVVALIFQFLGSLEYSTRRPKCVHWVYSYDCLNIPRRIVQTLWPRLPQNISNHTGGHEESNADLAKSPPIVTAYRLLVSTIVSFVCLVKVIYAYRGESSAVTTLEWIVAVPMTLCLYYIGLFEDIQDAAAPRILFDVDYSRQTTIALQRGALYLFNLGGVTLCGYWVQYWVFIMLVAWDSCHTPQTEDTTHGHPRFARSVKFTIFFLSLSMAQAGTLLLSVIIWPLMQMTGWPGVRWAKFMVFCLLVVPLYFTSVMLCMYSALTLFTVPNANDAPLHIFLEFVDAASYEVIVVYVSITLLMTLWPGLAIEVVRAAISFRRIYSIFRPII